MTKTHRHLTHASIVTLALVLAVTAATPSHAKSAHALTIQAVAVRGNELAITVANHTGKSQTGAVTAQTLTSRGPIRVIAPVTAAAGQSVTIRVEFPERLQDEVPLGVVVDDGVPF